MTDTQWAGVLLAALLGGVTAFAAEPLRVELDPTAAAFSEGDVRIAIEKELGRPAHAPANDSPRRAREVAQARATPAPAA